MPGPSRRCVSLIWAPLCSEETEADPQTRFLRVVRRPLNLLSLGGTQAGGGLAEAGNAPGFQNTFQCTQRYQVGPKNWVNSQLALLAALTPDYSTLFPSPAHIVCF